MEKKKKEKGAFWAERKSRLGAIILLAVTFSAMLLIVAPFEIYCNNLAELEFSASDFLGWQTVFAVILATIIFCLLFFIPKIVYDYAYPVFVGLLFMSFLQTLFLNVGITSLAGDQMGDEISTFTYIWNTALWVLIPAGFAVGARFIKDKKIPGIEQSISSLVALVLTIVVFSTQLMNFTVGALTTKGAFEPGIDRAYGKYAENPRFLTNKDIEKVGEDRNVIMFCVDRMDTLLYAEPAMKKYPKSFEFLNDGFTYYDDMVSRYAYTFPSVGYMLSGIEYNHEDSHSEYFDKVYNHNNTLSKLKEEGYSINLYAENYYDYSNANEMDPEIGNSIETDRDTLKVEVRKPMMFSLAITKMALYRTFPHILKSSVGGVNSDTCNAYITYTSDDLGGYERFAYGLKSVRDYIKEYENNFQTKGQKNFSFIHMAGCHDASYDINWKKRKSVKETQSDVLVSAKHSMDIINMYINSMKALSREKYGDERLYDDATIIIVGDHGKTGDRLKNLSDPMVTAMFVKPRKSSIAVWPTEMQISNAPVSQASIWPTIFESEKIDYDKSLFEAESVFWAHYNFQRTGLYPERKFDWTKRVAGMSSYKLVPYTVNGRARDLKNWTRGDEVTIDHPLFVN